MINTTIFTFTTSKEMHAQLATEWVNFASQFQSQLTICYRHKRVDLKSILGLMSLGTPAGTTLTLEISGESQDTTLLACQDYFLNSQGCQQA